MSNEVSTEPEAADPSARLILEAVSAAFGISVRDMQSPRRHAAIVQARYAAYHLSRTLTRKSLPQIGRDIGGRDHTTVLHGCREADAMMASDPDFKAKVHAAHMAVLAMQRTPEVSARLAERFEPGDPIMTARVVLTNPVEGAIRIAPPDLAAIANRLLAGEDIFADTVRLLRIIDELVLDFPSDQRRRELARAAKRIIPKITRALAALGHVKHQIQKQELTDERRDESGH